MAPRRTSSHDEHVLNLAGRRYGPGVVRVRDRVLLRKAAGTATSAGLHKGCSRPPITGANPGSLHSGVDATGGPEARN